MATSIQQPTKRRPVGVTILAILGFVSTAFSLLVGLGLISVIPLVLSAGPPAEQIIAPEARILGVCLLLIGIVQLLFSVGMWALEGWAWILGQALVVVGVAADIWLGARGHAPIWVATVGVAIQVLILWYLLTATVRRAFGKA
jgi:hypothetical protein